MKIVDSEIDKRVEEIILDVNVADISCPDAFFCIEAMNPRPCPVCGQSHTAEFILKTNICQLQPATRKSLFTYCALCGFVIRPGSREWERIMQEALRVRHIINTLYSDIAANLDSLVSMLRGTYDSIQYGVPQGIRDKVAFGELLCQLREKIEFVMFRIGMQDWWDGNHLVNVSQPQLVAAVTEHTSAHRERNERAHDAPHQSSLLLPEVMNTVDFLDWAWQELTADMTRAERRKAKANKRIIMQTLENKLRNDLNEGRLESVTIPLSMSAAETKRAIWEQRTATARLFSVLIKAAMPDLHPFGIPHESSR